MGWIFFFLVIVLPLIIYLVYKLIEKIVEKVTNFIDWAAKGFPRPPAKPWEPVDMVMQEWLKYKSLPLPFLPSDPDILPHRIVRFVWADKWRFERYYRERNLDFPDVVKLMEGLVIDAHLPSARLNEKHQFYAIAEKNRHFILPWPERAWQAYGIPKEERRFYSPLFGGKKPLPPRKS